MKKKILTLMLAACMVTALTACGSSKEEGQSQDTTEVSGNGIISTKDYDPDDYVKLGDYEGITVNTPMQMWMPSLTKRSITMWSIWMLMTIQQQTSRP